MPDEFELTDLGGLLVGTVSARGVDPAVGRAREWGVPSCLGRGLSVAHRLEVEVSIAGQLDYLAQDLVNGRVAGPAPGEVIRGRGVHPQREHLAGGAHLRCRVTVW